MQIWAVLASSAEPLARPTDTTASAKDAFPFARAGGDLRAFGKDWREFLLAHGCHKQFTMHCYRNSGAA
jgi:hypothetical protein